MLFKSIKIVIAVKKRMSFPQTESGNQAINGFPNGMTMRPQLAVVLRRIHCQSLAAGIEYLELG